jgi:hypothetical protein
MSRRATTIVRRLPFLLVLLAACEGSAEQSSAAPTGPELPVSVPATDQRPYSFKLPEGWTIDATVHPDGSSLVLGPADRPELQAGGQVFGIVQPSGTMVEFTPPPTDEQLASLEAEGDVTLDDDIAVDGHPAWQIVMTTNTGPAAATLFAGVDVGDGAGFTWIMTMEDEGDIAGLLQAIFRSIRIDEDRVDTTLSHASIA